MRQNAAQLLETTQAQVELLAKLGWYHSMELPDGSTIEGLQSVDRLRKRLAFFPIGNELHGKRVLDVGASDGWFSFEMERRGAQVLAVDRVRNENFLVARELLQSSVVYEVADISKLSLQGFGQFDIVLCLGVLYHVKHPLLALENLSALSRDLVCLESYVTDAGENAESPMMEFYEGCELGGQFDNWFGFNTACLIAMARSTGFATVKLEGVLEQRAHLTCRVRWEESIGEDDPGPILVSVENTVTRDHSFSTTRDDYVSFWFKSNRGFLDCENVFIEIGPYGARPARVSKTEADGWHAVCSLPRGLCPSWHQARLRVAGSTFSNAVRLPIDQPTDERDPRRGLLTTGEFAINLVTDGNTWEHWRIRVGQGSCVSVWVRGIRIDRLSELSLVLGNICLPVSFVSPEGAQQLRQLNAAIPSRVERGRVAIAVEQAGLVSDSITVDLY